MRLVFIILTLLVCFSCKNDKSEYVDIQNIKGNIFASSTKIPDNHFLGDQACKSCHGEQFKEWKGSHHDKAMQIANDSTVLGNFNNTIFKSQEVTSKFYKKEGDFYVNTEGRDGEYHDYKIEYTFGVEPLQQYIVKFPDGHYQCLRTAWDTEKQKWFDLYPDFKVVHSEWLHWSRGGLNWNNMCADCHSTNVRKNYDLETNSYDTKYALINVNCEACHGPGKDHVEAVNRLGDNYTFEGELKMTFATEPKALVDECARCHVRREQYSEYYNFEGTFLDHYFPQLIANNLYYPDGQILDEVYVYGSFLQSKMYQNNVTCTNCHNPHSLELRFKGNMLCAQCHDTKVYDTTEHHFHDVDSEGAECINCHMTGKIYMGNDYRRDHSFRIPRPDLSLKYGTPNACTQCHTDKDDTWAWDNYKKTHGEPKSKHFSDLLAPGLTGDPHGFEKLLELSKDTIYPEMARASAIMAMGNYLDENAINNMLSFLNDDSPLVRGAVIDALNESSSNDLAAFFIPLLKDKKRTVRVKAFLAVASVNQFQIPEEYKEVYKKVEQEFNDHLQVTADFSGGRAKKAMYYLKKGDVLNAIVWYEKALEVDDLNNMLRMNLANLYYRNQQFEEAEAAFKLIIKQEPDYAQTYYSYALLLAELNRTEEAVKQMELAIKHMPENVRFYYNLSLLYDKINNLEKAERTAAKGLKLAPNNESLLYVLAYIYQKQGNINKAVNIASRLVQLYPNNQQYRVFLNQISTPK
ncbi:doubled CXXCH domain-containing protein [Hyunsoonleella jejuensis]|uniref:Doubled CXXCH domain-containing protein n=1 Tax=Hyunsoonleella jejuensis TaxID=419940 RepID=A0A1H9DTF7_9FLAO|nr:tetratricopeptide repeat protein [Hyunsoonleella jejuensis]SEQ16732.1 doubled CXXCH domain-containing protein [Hyunsoonleella jejuensis]